MVLLILSDFSTDIQLATARARTVVGKHGLVALKRSLLMELFGAILKKVLSKMK